MAAVGSCARLGTPPGGPEDHRPPVVVRTEPDTLIVAEDFRGPVRFHFDERVSERVSGGQLEDAVIVSPRTGDVHVSHGRTSISVDIDGGFRPGLVYRVTLLPVISDLFGNSLRDPFEVVFSTGAPVSRGALVGLAFDRITGRGVGDAQVRALSEGDSMVYLTRTDTGGIYVMRFLPPARYRVTAWQDRNRSDTVDRMEPQGTRGALIPGEDTLFLDLPVLQPDTTPARLTGAEALDSVTVALQFDDFLDPDVPASQASFSLVRDSTAPAGGAPTVAQALREYEYVLWVDRVRDSIAEADSIRRAELAEAGPVREDTAEAADTAAAPSEAVLRPVPAIPPPLPAAGGAPRRGGGSAEGEGDGPPRAPDGSILPARRVVIRLQGFLERDVPYRVRAQGITNIALVPQGGGEVGVLLEAPPPDSVAASDTAVVDTTVVDTTVVVPDTGGVGLAWLRQRAR